MFSFSASLNSPFELLSSVNKLIKLSSEEKKLLSTSKLQQRGSKAKFPRSAVAWGWVGGPAPPPPNNLDRHVWSAATLFMLLFGSICSFRFDKYIYGFNEEKSLGINALWRLTMLFERPYSLKSSGWACPRTPLAARVFGACDSPPPPHPSK